MSLWGNYLEGGLPTELGRLTKMEATVNVNANFVC